MGTTFVTVLVDTETDLTAGAGITLMVAGATCFTTAFEVGFGTGETTGAAAGEGTGIGIETEATAGSRMTVATLAGVAGAGDAAAGDGA